MSIGAQVAQGEVLLFLHTDTLLPEGADILLLEGLKKSGTVWGRFDVRLSGRHPGLRLVECLMNLRSRLTGIATGDQAIFVQREALNTAGGFPDLPLMEDIALSSALKCLSRPLCLFTPAITSSRRWEEQGILHTILLMWWLRLRYFLGADPGQLVKRYYRH
jgi:rSAM/selenodomain-associated transferase 2